MEVSQELLSIGRRIETLEAKLKVVAIKEKGLYMNGDDTPLSELDAAIRDLEERKIDLYCKYQNLLRRMAKTALRGIRFDAVDSM